MSPTWPDPEGLVATGGFLPRSTLDDPPGLLEAGLPPILGGPERFRFLLWRPDEVVLGLGEAARLALPSGLAGLGRRPPGKLRAWLAGCPLITPEQDRGARDRGDDQPGLAAAAAARPQPLAVGALPFDPGEPTELVVPRLILHRGRCGPVACTVVRPQPAELASVRSWLSAWHDGRRSGRAASEGGQLEQPLPPMPPLVWARLEPPAETFEAEVATALEMLAAGKVTKVVLARRVRLGFSDPVPIGALLRRLRAAEPSATVFAVGSGDRWFAGATPELVVSRRNREVWAAPLAGTARRPRGAGTGEPGTGELGDVVARLLASPKERAEHQVVVDEVAAALRRAGAAPRVPAVPSAVVLRRVVHLGSRITGQLRVQPGRPLPDALDLLAEVHPTPAVAGQPREAAVEVLADLEGVPRGSYAGAVGLVDAAGDGQFWLGIRSVEIEGDEAQAIAGAGVVQGSVPAVELAETAAKLETVLEALGVDPERLTRPGPPPARSARSGAGEGGR